MNRRSFLGSAALGAAALPFHALRLRAQAVDNIADLPRRAAAGYGPLAPVNDATTGLPLLRLPQGFMYRSFGWTGDPMGDRVITPPAHDGMAAFAWGPGRILLVRNHEIEFGAPFSHVTYDGNVGGGTTTLEFDTWRGELVNDMASLSGTVRNCAGGRTPWDTWLTCEETTAYTTMPHGYVFSVPAGGWGDPRPIYAMGRFCHEAVAIDAVTGWVYETEDGGGASGLYRFVPNRPGHLHEGGRLYMLKVRDVPNAELGASYQPGTMFHVSWVPIDEPDNWAPDMPPEFVRTQGQRQGAATFGRLEGCFYGNDRIYIAATDGGSGPNYVAGADGGTGQGQVWQYNPRNETIQLLFESPGAAVLKAPDNITVSPRGGIVLCEDGGGEEYIHGLTVDGELFPFVKNNIFLRGEHNGIVGDFSWSEFTGPCYSPDGEWLFFNVQAPGITFAVTGPWGSGVL